MVNIASAVGWASYFALQAVATYPEYGGYYQFGRYTNSSHSVDPLTSATFRSSFYHNDSFTLPSLSTPEIVPSASFPEGPSFPSLPFPSLSLPEVSPVFPTVPTASPSSPSLSFPEVTSLSLTIPDHEPSVSVSVSGPQIPPPPTVSSQTPPSLPDIPDSPSAPPPPGAPTETDSLVATSRSSSSQTRSPQTPPWSTSPPSSAATVSVPSTASVSEPPPSQTASSPSTDLSSSAIRSPDLSDSTILSPSLSSATPCTPTPYMKFIQESSTYYWGIYVPSSYGSFSIEMDQGDNWIFDSDHFHPADIVLSNGKVSYTAETAASGADVCVDDLVSADFGFLASFYAMDVITGSYQANATLDTENAGTVFLNASGFVEIHPTISAFQDNDTGYGVFEIHVPSNFTPFGISAESENNWVFVDQYYHFDYDGSSVNGSFSNLANNSIDMSYPLTHAPGGAYNVGFAIRPVDSNQVLKKRAESDYDATFTFTDPETTMYLSTSVSLTQTATSTPSSTSSSSTASASSTDAPTYTITYEGDRIFIDFSIPSSIMERGSVSYSTSNEDNFEIDSASSGTIPQSSSAASFEITGHEPDNTKPGSVDVYISLASGSKVKRADSWYYTIKLSATSSSGVIKPSSSEASAQTTQVLTTTNSDGKTTVVTTVVAKVTSLVSDDDDTLTSIDGSAMTTSKADPHGETIKTSSSRTSGSTTSSKTANNAKTTATQAGQTVVTSVNSNGDTTVITTSLASGVALYLTTDRAENTVLATSYSSGSDGYVTATTNADGDIVYTTVKEASATATSNTDESSSGSSNHSRGSSVSPSNGAIVTTDASGHSTTISSRGYKTTITGTDSKGNTLLVTTSVPAGASAILTTDANGSQTLTTVTASRGSHSHSAGLSIYSGRGVSKAPSALLGVLTVLFYVLL
ncbi:hypothetical protein KL905_004051 [Ogataea polymorpha]|nr:hypothetical protein KL905_004051 [Ogataea polymorpha]